jgi:diadenylate cyclase
MLTNITTALSRFTLADLADILLVAFILYSLILLIKDTKAYQMAIGMGIVGLFFLVTRWGKLTVSNWLIKNFVTYLIIAVIILFRKPLVLRSFQEKIEELFLAVDYMSQRKMGGLIAIEKEISLENYADRGTKIDAVISRDLIVSLFYPHSPLHDGAVLIRGSNIMAAGCLLPLPASHNLQSAFLTRTRHLAAIGLSHETDAAVIVISEETGRISLAVKGVLQGIQNKDELKERLLDYLRQ